jgi:mRNA-degrading endonuclease toxin of MazEF toxin-antitoxin module
MEVEHGGIYLYDPPTETTSEQAAILVTSGSEQSGMRPFIIVSRDLINKKPNQRTAVGVPMSTKTNKANSYRIALPAADLLRWAGSSYEFQDSVALCDHVRVLDLNQVKRRIGTLSANAVPSVGLGLAYVFDLR